MNEWIKLEVDNSTQKNEWLDRVGIGSSNYKNNKFQIDSSN